MEKTRKDREGGEVEIHQNSNSKNGKEMLQELLQSENNSQKINGHRQERRMQKGRKCKERFSQKMNSHMQDRRI